MIVLKKEIPTNSLLQNEPNDFSYIDSFHAEIIDEPSVEISRIADLFFNSAPQWVDKMMKLRDKIVKPLGLKTSDDIEDNRGKINIAECEIGQQVGIFKIFNKTENEIILGEDDTHLNFRVSLMLNPLKNKKKDLSITTAVRFNNSIGKLYFLPVKPFHKFIVRGTLKNIIRQLQH